MRGIWLLAVGGVVLAAALADGHSGAEEPVSRDCDPPSNGYWNITRGMHVVCVDESLTLHKLRIEGARVEFLRVDLTIDEPPGKDGSSIAIHSSRETVLGELMGGRWYVRDSTIRAVQQIEGTAIAALGLDSTFHFINSTLDNFEAVSVTSSMDDVLIQDSRFLNVTHGVEGNAGEPLRILGNLFVGSSNTAIYTQSTPVIENNTITDCSTGIIFQFDSAAPRIAHNTITHCQTGIGQSMSTRPQLIHDNDIYGNYNTRFCTGRTCPTSEAGFYGDGTWNWWGSPSPDPIRLRGGFDHDPWRVEPLHPERLPRPAIAPISVGVHRGEAVSLDAFGSLPSQHFGFPITSYAWDWGDGATTRGSEPVGTHTYQDLGEHVVELTVCDEVGICYWTTRSLEVTNQAPRVTRIEFDAVEAGRDLVAAVLAEDPEGDDIELSYAWHRNGVLQSDLTSDSVLGYRVNGMAAWRVTVTATDEHGDASAGEAFVTVPNRAPHLTSLSLNPIEPTASTPLQALASAEDPDDHATHVRYEWRKNGNLQSGLTERFISTNHLHRDDTWQVTAIPADGHDDGEPGTQSMTIRNTPPSIPNLAIDASRAGQDIWAVVEAADPDGDEVQLAYAWMRNGQPEPDLAGAVVPGDRVRDGDTWRVTVTPWDGIAQGPSASVQVVVENQPPVVDSLTLRPEEPTATTPLVAETAAVDPEGENVTLTYEWIRNGEIQEDLTESTVPTRWLARGDVWRVQVVASDGSSQTMQQSSVVVVRNTSPVVQAAYASPDTVRVGEVVALSVDVVDPDGDDVLVTWISPDGSTLSGAAVSVPFPEPGTHNVSYAVTDGGPPARGAVTVTVEIPHPRQDGAQPGRKPGADVGGNPDLPSTPSNSPVQQDGPLGDGDEAIPHPDFTHVSDDGLQTPDSPNSSPAVEAGEKGAPAVEAWMAAGVVCLVAVVRRSRHSVRA